MRSIGALCLLAVACHGESASASPALKVTSKAFKEGQPMPVENTCDGGDQSPALAVAGVPAGAKVLALIVDDPDAPKGLFTHWLVWNAPVSGGFGEGSTAAGAIQGTNDFGHLGWNGPCPPPGKPHRYRFHVLALDAPLSLTAQVDREAFDMAVKGHVVAEGTLTGTYSRRTK